MGDYVIYGPWLGRVDDIVQNVTVLFDDNAKCKIKRADLGLLIPLCHNLVEDENYPYYPGQCVRGISSTVFKNAQWLQGTRKAGRIEGTISNVEFRYLYVYWIAASVLGSGSQSPTTPTEQQDPKKLTLMSCFSHANWKIGDWCLVPTYENFSTSVTTNMEDIASDGDTKTVKDNDSLKANSGSTNDDASSHEKIYRNLVKRDQQGWLVYAGRWFDPLRQSMDAFMEKDHRDNHRICNIETLQRFFVCCEQNKSIQLILPRYIFF